MIDRDFAEKLLFVWGLQMRSRAAKGEYRGLFVGNMDSGTYRPEDDPHPHSFVVCIVDKALKDAGPELTAYAVHVYVWGRSPHSFSTRWKASQAREELLAYLLGHSHRWHDAIPAQNAAEILRDLAAFRGSRGGRPRKTQQVAF